MEIIDYLRIARRRRGTLIVIPVVAVLLTAAFVVLSPLQYTATATVSTVAFVGGAGSPYSGTQGVSQFVGAFTAAAQSPQTKAAVEEATGVRPADQSAGLEINPVGTSSDMRVTFVGNDRDVSEAVVRQTSVSALDQMFDARTAQAAAARDKADEAVKAANAAITELGKANGVADIPSAYDTLLAQLGNLQQQQATLRATGNPIGAAALEAAIADTKKSLEGFVPLLAQYNDLAARQTAASSDLQGAQAEYRHAQSLQASADGDAVVYVGDTPPVDKMARFWGLLLPVLGASIFLAVFLVLLLELLSRSRTSGRIGQSRPEHTPDEPDAVVGGPTSTTTASEPAPAPANDDAESDEVERHEHETVAASARPVAPSARLGGPAER